MNQDLRIAYLAELIVTDVLIAKLSGQVIERLIGLQADGFVYLYLQNQMGTTLQIQTYLDVFGKIITNLGGRCRKCGQSYQAKNAEQNDQRNENGFPLEIRIHLFFFIRADTGNSAVRAP